MKAILTVQAEGQEPIVFHLEDFNMIQERHVETVRDNEGEILELVPDEVVTLTITGSFGPIY